MIIKIYCYFFYFLYFLYLHSFNICYTFICSFNVNNFLCFKSGALVLRRHPVILWKLNMWAKMKIRPRATSGVSRRREVKHCELEAKREITKMDDTLLEPVELTVFSMLTRFAWVWHLCFCRRNSKQRTMTQERSNKLNS